MTGPFLILECAVTIAGMPHANILNSLFCRTINSDAIQWVADQALNADEHSALDSSDERSTLGLFRRQHVCYACTGLQDSPPGFKRLQASRLNHQNLHQPFDPGLWQSHDRNRCAPISRIVMFNDSGTEDFWALGATPIIIDGHRRILLSPVVGSEFLRLIS